MEDLKNDTADLSRGEASAMPPQLSFGEKAVGLTFNPGGHPLVNAFNRRYADLIDDLNVARETTTNPEAKRQLSVAITEAQTSQMWAVKAATWQY